MNERAELALAWNSNAALLGWPQQFLQQLPDDIPAVWRDLAWLLLSPDMLADLACQAYALEASAMPQAVTEFLVRQQAELKQQLLHHTTVSGSVLDEFIATAGLRRLGLYGERLLHFFFAHQQNLLAHGLQVQRGKQTLGEFDFVLHAQPQACWHIELACKFYLCVPGPDAALSLYDFLGPNLADSLGAKLHKIIQAQLHLADYAEAQELLRQRAYGDLLGAFAQIKGCLFYRPADLGLTLPAALAPQHARGLILELDELQAMPVAGAVYLDRLQWLAPRDWPTTEVSSLSAVAERLQAHWQIQPNPQMLALLQAKGTGWQEVVRVFVIPPGWWQRAQALPRPGLQT